MASSPRMILRSLQNHLQDQLRDVEKSRPAGDDHGQGPITKLLSVLLVEEVAFRLHRKTSTASLTVDIASHVCRIQRDYFDYADYRTLSQLVIRKAPDADIWKAVIDVIDTAIEQDFEEKQRVVRKQVFKEIRYCTYRDVDGFFEKYFEGKDWTPHVLNIYEVAKNRHGGLPGSALHAEALNWWLQFQDEFLSEARSRYYSTTKLANLEASRQMDLFLRRKNVLLSDTAHDWKHVEVVGKLKKEFDNDVEEALLQIGGYVWNVFSHQPTRRFVHAFTICGNIMEVWVFDRSGCYSPGAFDIHKDPKRFIQVIAGYAMMNEQELGLEWVPRQEEVVAEAVCFRVSRGDRRPWDILLSHKNLRDRRLEFHDQVLVDNIIITDNTKKTGLMGMLIDLSHAEDLSTGPRPSDERRPVGTVQFMACQVLYNIDHTYRHDLESFFYVLIWLCARHGWGDRWPEDSLLIDWYTGTYRTIAISKIACRSPRVFEELLMEFPSDFECLKPLCRELRGLLFPIRGQDFFMGTPEDPETLYKPMIEAFDKAINSIKAEKE